MSRSFPLFRTLVPVASFEPESVAMPVQENNQRSPLPRVLWRTGIGSLEHALAEQERLSLTHYTAVGRDQGGYYIRAPSQDVVNYMIKLELPQKAGDEQS